MLALTIVLTVLVSFIALIWLSRHLQINREHQSGFVLTGRYAGPPAQAPMISVVVAAKDEEANIETCIRSMLTQDYPHFELIVCNDRSGDRTAEIVASIAREDSRVKLINIDHLPAGWCGKNHAMQHGIATAQGQYICMIDADCKQTSPRTLSVALQYAQDNASDLLSVLPKLEMIGFWEQAIQPVCSGIMMIWFTPEKVNSPKYPNAYANGAFMLITRQAYEAIGTHEALRDKVNEDMNMAALVKARGMNLRVVRCDGLYTVRMYTSLRAILNGWSRIFFGTFATLRRMGIALAVLVVMGLLPHLAAILGLSLSAVGAEPVCGWRGLGIAGLLAAAMQLSVTFRFFGLVGAKRPVGLTYPVGCLVAIYAVCLAIGKLRKGAKLTWRGTSYTS